MSTRGSPKTSALPSEINAQLLLQCGNKNTPRKQAIRKYWISRERERERVTTLTFIWPEYLCVCERDPKNQRKGATNGNHTVNQSEFLLVCVVGGVCATDASMNALWGQQ